MSPSESTTRTLDDLVDDFASSVGGDVRHLLLPHAVVQPARLHELLVCALLDDLALLEDEDEIYRDGVSGLGGERGAEATYRLRRPSADGAR